jgi:hypothetical protein
MVLTFMFPLPENLGILTALLSFSAKVFNMFGFFFYSG